MLCVLRARISPSSLRCSVTARRKEKKPIQPPVCTTNFSLLPARPYSLSYSASSQRPHVQTHEPVDHISYSVKTYRSVFVPPAWVNPDRLSIAVERLAAFQRLIHLQTMKLATKTVRFTSQLTLASCLKVPGLSQQHWEPSWECFLPAASWGHPWQWLSESLQPSRSS